MRMMIMMMIIIIMKVNVTQKDKYSIIFANTEKRAL